MNKKTHYRHILRRIIFALFTVTAFILQCTVLPLSGLSFPVFLLIPLLVSVAMFEKEFSGFFFGLFAGALWDTASTLPDGLLAFFISFYGFLSGLLSRHLLRNTLLNALILSASGLVLYSALALFAIPGSLPVEAYINLIKSIYLPGGAFALLLNVPIYFTVRAVSLKFREASI